MPGKLPASAALIFLSTISFVVIVIVVPLIYYLVYKPRLPRLPRLNPPKVAPRQMNEEEEAFLAKLWEIVRRTHQDGHETALFDWRAQLAWALSEVTKSPAADGKRRAFGQRKQLAKPLKRLLPTLKADLAGVDLLVTCIELDHQITHDTDGDGDFDEHDICASTVDVSPIYALERACKEAKPLDVEARFVPEAKSLLEKRRVDFMLLEGVKELDESDLRAGLKDISIRRASGRTVGAVTGLEPIARRVLQRLELMERLDDAANARNLAALVAAVEEAGALSTTSQHPQLRERFEATLLVANATLGKLSVFQACQQAVDAEDAEALRVAMDEARRGWWMDAHWFDADKAELKSYQLAYKRMTVLDELRTSMEPLQAGRLQAAVDSALQVKMADPLVDRAIELLNSLDRETAIGCFSAPYDSGGAFGTDDWLSNPHFKLSFRHRDGGPQKVRATITCTEGTSDGGDTDAQHFGEFALHVVRMPGDPEAREVRPGFDLLADSAYSFDTAVVSLDELDCAEGCFIIPSTQVQGEEGPFVLNVICETPGADLVLEPVVQLGDFVLRAIGADDLDELERLLKEADEKNLTRVHRAKGRSYLRRRRAEVQLSFALDGPIASKEKRIAALRAGLEGVTEAGVPPSLVERAERLLARLVALQDLAAADEAGEWEGLDRAINSASAAEVEEEIIAPYRKRMCELRASTRLSACLAKGEEGYPVLQAAFDEACAAGLIGADIDEAGKILKFLANSQRFFRGQFEPWMGGGYGGGAASRLPTSSMPLAAEGPALNGELPRWIDNPQYRLVVGDVAISKFRVSVDKASGAPYEAYAVHVVKATQGRSGDAVPPMQVGRYHRIVASTAYLPDSEHEGSTAALTFEAEASATYFIVPSTRELKQQGGFSVTTIGIGSYELEPIRLVQGQLLDAMESGEFDRLPQLVDLAESESAGLAQHPLVSRAKLVSEMESAWVDADADALGAAVVAAKRAKVEPSVVQLYMQRRKQLAIETKLKHGMAGNTALLHAACEEAKLIGYSGSMLREAEDKHLKKFSRRTSLTSLFHERNAAGARKFGAWRENPAWKVSVKKKCTLFVAVNEGGELTKEMRAKLAEMEAKEQATYGKAKDKLVAAKAAADADPKNDELAAAAKDAERVFNDLDASRRRKKARDAMGEEADAFSRLGLHVVRNTRTSWIPGVLSDYVDLALPNGADPIGDSVYGDDQAFCSVEVAPAGDGPATFIVPSTWVQGEEGVFTLSLMSTGDFQVEEVTRRWRSNSALQIICSAELAPDAPRDCICAHLSKRPVALLPGGRIRR